MEPVVKSCVTQSDSRKLPKTGNVHTRREISQLSGDAIERVSPLQASDWSNSEFDNWFAESRTQSSVHLGYSIDARTRYQQALMFAHGVDGHDKDLQRAKQLYREAAELGDRDAEFELMLLEETHLRRKGYSELLPDEKKDLDIRRIEAVRLLKEYAKKGHIEAMYELGAMHFFHTLWDEPCDDTLAAEYLTAAAKFQHPEAHYVLGMMHFTGTHFTTNSEKAFEFLIQAEHFGSKNAAEMLITEYKSRIGSRKVFELVRKHQLVIMDTLEYAMSYVLSKIRKNAFSLLGRRSNIVR